MTGPDILPLDGPAVVYGLVGIKVVPLPVHSVLVRDRGDRGDLAAERHFDRLHRHAVLYKRHSDAAEKVRRVRKGRKILIVHIVRLTGEAEAVHTADRGVGIEIFGDRTVGIARHGAAELRAILKVRHDAARGDVLAEPGNAADIPFAREIDACAAIPHSGRAVSDDASGILLRRCHLAERGAADRETVIHSSGDTAGARTWRPRRKRCFRRTKCAQKSHIFRCRSAWRKC